MLWLLGALRGVFFLLVFNIRIRPLGNWVRITFLLGLFLILRMFEFTFFDSHSYFFLISFALWTVLSIITSILVLRFLFICRSLISAPPSAGLFIRVWWFGGSLWLGLHFFFNLLLVRIRGCDLFTSSNPLGWLFMVRTCIALTPLRLRWIIIFGLFL